MHMEAVLSIRVVVACFDLKNKNGPKEDNIVLVVREWVGRRLKLKKTCDFLHQRGRGCVSTVDFV